MQKDEREYRINPILKFLKSKNLHIVLLTIILFGAFFFRFYNTPERYSLGIDSSRDSLVAIGGASLRQLPLTGPFSSIGQFTFGPWYYYQLIIFTLVTQLEYAPWIYMGIASMFFVLVMYKIGTILADRSLGLILALLTSLSPPQISSATLLLNPNLIPLYAGLSIVMFLELSRKNLSNWYSFLFGLILGIGINHHYQMAGLLVLPVILLVYKRHKYLYFLTAALGILVSFIPLLIFDLNNHWYTVRNMFIYYTEGKNAIYVPNRWLFYLRDFWPAFWSYALGLPLFIGVLSLSWTAFLISWEFVKKRLPTQLVLLLIAFATNFVLLRYYWGERGYGYLQFLYPLMFMFFGFALWRLTRIRFVKYLSPLVVLTVAVVMLPASIGELKVNDFEREMHRRADNIKQFYKNQNPSLYICSEASELQMQALTSLLNLSQKDQNGKKVGIIDQKCGISSIPSDLLNRLGNENTGTVDFSAYAEEELIDLGWKPISPEIIYNKTVRWWFDEKP